MAKTKVHGFLAGLMEMILLSWMVVVKSRQLTVVMGDVFPFESIVKVAFEVIHFDEWLFKFIVNVWHDDECIINEVDTKDGFRCGVNVWQVCFFGEVIIRRRLKFGSMI